MVGDATRYTKRCDAAWRVELSVERAERNERDVFSLFSRAKDRSTENSKRTREKDSEGAVEEKGET